MLTTSSCVSSLRAKSSFTMRAVLASISALESSSHVIAPRSAWSFTPKEVSRVPPRRRFGVGDGLREPRSYSDAHLAAAQSTPARRAADVVAHRADAGAHEANDRMTDRVAHPAHLAVAALVDPELDRGAAMPSLHERARAPAR